MKEINIIVCIKQVPDPEAPASSFEIDSENMKVIPLGIPPVINPFDENALEAALRIKEKTEGRLFALCMEEKPAMTVLKKSLGVGAEELIILRDEQFENLDSSSTAYVLSAAIKKISGYTLIITGRQAADWGFGQAGSLIAEMLGLPCITLAQNVTVDDEKLIVTKIKKTGYEVIHSSLPAVVTASSEIGDLRLPSLKAIKEIKKKRVTEWNATDLGLDLTHLKKQPITKLIEPPSKERACTFISGDTPEEKGENLALRLRQDKVV
jgi:electron transfer flavoprotein beta subunit